MASSTLYPPIIDAYMPAFEASGNCRLYFSMSDYSSTMEEVTCTQLSIVKQSSGQTVVNKRDNAIAGRFRSTGVIIINSAPVQDGDLYYIDIIPEDVCTGDMTGWKEGWIYKVQIRLSTVTYPNDGTIGQSAWLNAQAENFSEWSTYCVLKAIGTSSINIPILDNSILDLSTLDIDGSYSNTDKDETLYSYQLFLKASDDTILEDSGVLYTNQYYSKNQFSYLFKYELQDSTDYKVTLKFITINKFEGTRNYSFTVNQTQSQETEVTVITVDNLNLADSSFVFDSTLVAEEEEGRIALKLYLDSSSYFNRKFYVRRASSRDDFTTWEDIKYIECNMQQINELPMFYDYTVESGVWYKYGIQTYDPITDVRGILHKNDPIIREFEFAYLIGEGGKQLKLKFDNIMGNYIYNVSDGKIDTIAGQYPFITRNGNTCYRTLPIAGLVSFNMDEKEVFTNMNELYVYSDVIQLYKNRKSNEHIGLYDFVLERDFRDSVIKFLKDGKPKLFKSATEGNIIVRLMDVAAQPNQTLRRMICSFSCNGHEIADNTMENYKKYKFYTVGDEGVE